MPAMASLPPSSGRPSLTPLSMFYPRRATSSGDPYAPPTSSPLSPYSTSLLPLETSVVTTNSHYYRPSHSSLTSPALSTISSPTHSPTRPSRQSRIKSLLATDPLLCHLTPVTIIRLSTSGDFDFEPGDKEWSLRAAEGTVKVNEWLREVEGWNREWRQTYREGKDAGDGYLPPTDTPKNRRKTGMGSIREEGDDELEEGVEYWGSLKRSVAEGYEARIEVIRSEIEELDVDGLKDRVLSYRASAADLLTDSSAIMAATTLQLLPPLSRLTKLLSIWAVRIAVLQIVPVFLRWLQIAKDALEAGYTAITHPSINPESSPLDKGWRGLEEESYAIMQETITQKVATAGRLMDTMLDALEGREDVLPERWIAELEDVEEGVGRWEMDGERVVLEGRLRLEEMRMRQSRKEEEAHEKDRTLLVLEQERSAQEARAEEEAAMDVMEKAEETDRRLREALETNDIVAEAIELPDDDESDWIEPDSNPKDVEELFSKLEDVEKERSLSGEDEDRGRRPKRAGSVDVVPSLNGMGNHLDPPEPPTASALLVVEEDQNEFLPVEEESGLPTATNGTFFSRLFSAIPQTPLHKAKQTSEEARPLPEAKAEAEREGITKLAEAEEKTLEAEARKVAELGARRLAEEELGEKARLELETEKAAEAKRLLLIGEAARKEKAAELERLAEAERQRLDAQRHEEESAAAKALDERRAIEAERAAVVEAARQVFVSEQAAFDDRRFQELDRQRRLAEDERVRLADVALAEREKAREAKQQAERIQREREIEEERVKAETLGQKTNNNLGVDVPDTETEEFQSIETSSTATLEDDLASDAFSCVSMDEGDQADMSDSMSNFEQEESSEIEIKPAATSTPKGNLRLTVSTGLDSIVEVLTPRSTRGQHFDESDIYRNESPGLDGSSEARERADPVGDSVFSSPTSLGEAVEKGMLPIESPEKVAKREISRDPTRATSASKNRSVAPRSSTPTLGKTLAKDQKQRFTLGSSSSAPSATAGYKRPTSRTEARPSSRQGNRPSSRAQEFRPSSKAPDTKTARPSSRAGPSTPGGPGDDGSNSSTPTGTPAPAIRPMRRLHRDTVSTTGADSDDDDDPRRFFRENAPEMNNSDFANVPKLQVTKRHAWQPSNFTSIVTPEKSSRFNKSPYVAEGSSLVLPTTPILQVDLDDRINEILGSLPSKLHLTASNLQKLSESTKRSPPIKPFDLSPTGIPGPKSVESSPPIASEVPSYARASARRHNSSSPGDIKLYHLHRTNGQAPIKLYIRLVGENGERVMVRVGGGWADLAEYLKEYVAHHGSKKRVVSEGRVEIQDLSTHSHHGRTLHPSRSTSSFRSASPGSMGSRPSSPLPGGNRPSTSFSMRRPESPMLMNRSESENPSLHTNPTTMRGGHNGTLPGNNKTSPTTPSDEAFPLQPVTATQLTPPNRNSPPSRPASRPGSSSSAGYRRPTSRLSFSESAFDDCGSINGRSSPSHLPPPQPLGLAGPKGKYVHPENQAWVEGVLGQVRKASADRRAQLLAAAAGHYGEGAVLPTG